MYGFGELHLILKIFEACSKGYNHWLHKTKNGDKFVKGTNLYSDKNSPSWRDNRQPKLYRLQTMVCSGILRRRCFAAQCIFITSRWSDFSTKIVRIARSELSHIRDICNLLYGIFFSYFGKFIFCQLKAAERLFWFHMFVECLDIMILSSFISKKII